MTTQRLFRFIWRVNAVVIFFAAGGACLMVAVLMISEVGCSARRRRAVEAAPPVVADARDKLYLGPVTAVEGTTVLRGELLATPKLELGSSGGYRGETRNVLYLDAGSTDARWLLPNSARVIAEEENVLRDEDDPRKRRQVAWFALVKEAGGDLEVEEGSLLVIDPTGRQTKPVAEKVRTINYAALQDDDTILVLYERGHRYVRAIIDSRSLEVKDVHEVAVPELK